MILQTNIYIVKQSKTQHTEKIVQYPDIFLYLIRTRYSITAWNGYKYGGFSGLYFPVFGYFSRSVCGNSGGTFRIDFLAEITFRDKELKPLFGLKTYFLTQHLFI